MDAGDGSEHRFGAFISYRHDPEDRTVAKWLHASLERYRLPKAARRPDVRDRVGRVFRDEEELAASSDLSGEIDQALRQARFLIVVCSPRTPASRWINEEVVRFRELGRGDRILALLMEGEPEESFPPALREIRPAAAGLAGGAAEPLAADLRPRRGESRRRTRDRAKLKLLAPLLGCRFDDLRQREQERRTRRAVQIGAFLATVLAIVAGLAVVSLLLYFREQDAHQLALGRQLTAQAEIVVSQHPDRHETGVLLAAEGLRRLEQQGVRTVESDRVFRAAIDLLPRPVSAVTVTAPITALAVDPSGRAFAAVSGDGGVRLFRADGDPPVAELQLQGEPLALAFSRDGSRFGVADRRAAIVIDVETGDAAGRIGELGATVRGRFTEDLDYFVAMGDVGQGADGTGVTVWKLDADEPVLEEVVREFPEGADDLLRRAPAAVAGQLRALFAWIVLERIPDDEEFAPRHSLVGPRGSYFARVGYVEDAGYIMVHDGWTGEIVERYGTGEFLPAVQFSADGQYLAWVESATATLTPVPPRPGGRRGGQGSFRRIQAEGGIRGLALSGDDRFVATVTGRAARLWEVGSGKEVCRAVHEEPIEQLALSARGVYLLTASLETARLWNCAPQRNGASLEGLDPGGTISPDGRLVAQVRAAGIRILELDSGRQLALLQPSDRGAQDLVWSPDGSLLAGGRGEVEVRVWRMPSGEALVFAAQGEPEGQPLAFSPDGRSLAVREDYERIAIWDLATGRVAGEVAVSFDEDVHLGAEGRYLTARDFRGVPQVWDLRAEPLLDEGAAAGAVVLIGASGLRATADDGGITVRDLAREQTVARFDLSGRAREMALSTEGSYLSAAVGREISVWPLRSNGEIGAITLDGPARGLAFDPGERFLATLDTRFLRLWDIAGPSEMARIPVEPSWFAEPETSPRVGFLPSGRMITMTMFGEIDRVWLWQPAEMIAAACAWLTRNALDQGQRDAFLGEEQPAVQCAPSDG